MNFVKADFLYTKTGNVVMKHFIIVCLSRVLFVVVTNGFTFPDFW